MRNQIMLLSLVAATALVCSCSDDSSSGGAGQADADSADSGSGGGDTGEQDSGPTDTDEGGVDATPDVAPSDTATADTTEPDRDDTAPAPDVSDSGGEDTEEGDAGEDAPEEDAGPKECVQVEVTGDWGLFNADDVSINFTNVIMPQPEGRFPTINLLFERYSPGPDVGTFELGGWLPDFEGPPDSDFGTCAHCVYMAGPTREIIYFADRGTLENELDPYSRRLRTRVTNLRLVEVEVDQMTRASTPIEGGNCVEVADFTATGIFPPDGWSCDPEQYNDGEACQCTCGAYDPDCAQGYSCLPGSPGCPDEPFTPLPLVDCEAEQICAFDPELASTACTDVCDWRAREGCEAGVCVATYGVTEEDTCLESDNRISDVVFGEMCNTVALQQVCNVVDGFALGYCGPRDVCRPICDSDDACTVEGETCQRFFFEPESLGYCGPDVMGE